MSTPPPSPAEATVHIAPLRGLAVRTLSRAHLLVQARPALAGLAAEALGAMEAALARELGAPLHLGATLGTSVVTPVRGLPEGAAYLLLELGAAGARAAVELELPAAVALAARVCGARAELAPATALTRLEEASLGYLALVVLGAAGRLAELTGARLVGVVVGGERARGWLEVGRRHVGVELRGEVPEARVRGRVLVPADAVRALAAGLPEAARPPSLAPAVAAARVPLAVRLCGTHLVEAVARTLGPGDVVLLADVRREGPALRGPAVLVARTFRLAGALSPEGFTPHGAATRAPSPEHPMSQPPPHDATALPIAIEVELTRLLVPLGELGALQPGQVLALRYAVGEPVTLRVGDRAVARAELVDIEGEVGARILSLVG